MYTCESRPPKASHLVLVGGGRCVDGNVSGRSGVGADGLRLGRHEARRGAGGGVNGCSRGGRVDGSLRAGGVDRSLGRGGLALLVGARLRVDGDLGRLRLGVVDGWHDGAARAGRVDGWHLG